MDLKDIVITNIIRLRKEQNLSQADLARYMEPPVTRGAINRFEKGSRMPNLDVIESMAIAFNVHPSEFFKGYEAD